MKKILLVSTAVAAAVLQLAGPGGNLWAQCTFTDPDYTCSGGGTYTVTVGNGKNDNGKNVTVDAGTTINVNNNSAISLGSGSGGVNATIDVHGTVQNYAVNNQGSYGTGSNTIQVGSHYTIHVYDGGTVASQGPQTNAEAINVHGFGNIITIDYGGTVSAEHDAAIWFQDSMDHDLLTSGAGCLNGDCRNRVENSGTISTAVGGQGTANVFGSSARGAEAGIIFTNTSTGYVYGSLNFGAGNDELNFVAGTGNNGEGTITGAVNGGGGSNTLTLSGQIGMSSTLTQQVSNFTQLNKKGAAGWTITGDLVNFDNVTVYDGTLTLTGDNSSFTGVMEVKGANDYTDWDGSNVTSTGGNLSARAQSLPTNSSGNVGNIINDGQVTLTNDTGDNATYVGQITGDGQLFKVGGGVVTLAPQAGANTYTGLTTIENGGLAISNPNALGTGNLTIGGVPGDTGTLYTLASMTLDRRISVGGTVGNSTGGINVGAGTTLTNNTGLEGANASGTFIKGGAGILELNGYNDFRGSTLIQNGTLRVNDNTANNLRNNISVFGGGRLEGVGSVGSAGHSVTNAGYIEPGNPSNYYGTLTIRGDYNGQPGGQVISNVVLGNDDSVHSTLVIEGDTGYIPNDVRVINNNGSGGHAPHGIPIIVVKGGDASTGRAFRLLHDYQMADGTTAVVGGTTLYRFQPFNLGGGNWEFRLLTVVGPDGKPVFNPALPLYEAYPAVLSRYLQLGTLQQRVGNRSWDTGGDRDIEPRGAWIKLEGQTGRYQAAKSQTDANFDLDYGMLRFSFDLPLWRTDEDSLLILGLGAHASRYGRATLKSSVGQGKIDVNMEGLDGTLTWYGQNGFYADFQARTSWFNSDLKSHSLSHNHQTLKNDGFGYAFGLEAGWEAPLNRSWSLTPQIQGVFTDVEFDNFTDTQNNEVISGKSQSLVGRLGLALNYDNLYTARDGDERRVRAYVIPNLYHEFLDGTKVSVAGVDFERRDERLWGGLSVGGTVDWKDFSIYGELGARTSLENFGDSRQFSGEAGFRINF